jgi:alkaline phosphatase D
LPDFSKFHEFAPTPEGQAIVKGLIDAVAPSPLGVQLRVASAMGVVKAPINRDDWNGVAVQRRELLSAFMQKTNFPIVLGGDVHDSFAFTLFESGFEEGKLRQLIAILEIALTLIHSLVILFHMSR